MIGSVPITHCEMGTCLMRCCSGGRSGSSKKLSTWWQPSPFLCALLVDHNCFHVVGIHLWIILSYIRESLQYFVNRHDHGNSITQSLLVISGQSSITQSFPTLCDPMDSSMPGFPVLHHLLELAQTHVHWVSDAIQPSHPLSPPFCSCPQSFPVSGSFPMSHLFASGGQNIGTSTSASVLAINIQDWFPFPALIFLHPPLLRG